MKKFFLFFSLFFATNVVDAQNLILKVDNASPTAGEIIEVTIESSLNNNFQFKMPNDFVSGSVLNGMTRKITNFNNSTVYYRIENGYFKKEGTYTIGPAKVQSGNKIYSSNKIVIEVKGASQSSSNKKASNSSKNLSDKIAFGLIETNKNSVYVGEPVKINARVYAQFEPKSFEDYREYVSKGLPDKHKIPNPEITNVEVKNYQNKRFYSFSYDESICFPAEAGTFTIQPFELTLGNFFDQEKVVSETASIVVKPLPGDKPISFNGSVGKISMERILKKTPKKQGDVALISIVFSGYGNLHSIDIPELNLPSGIQLYGDPSVKEDFQFTSKGVEGKLTIEYNLQMLDPGMLKIPEYIFSFFDIETEKYVILKADSIQFAIERTPGFNREKAMEEANKRLASKKAKKESSDSWLTRNILWLMSGIGFTILIALLFLLLRKRDKKEEVVIQNSVEKSELESPSITHDLPIYAVNIDSLKSISDNPQSYISALSVEMDKWLNAAFESSNQYLSRVEKIEQLANSSEWKNKIHLVKAIYQKIDEVRYGLPADTYFCQQVQSKVEELFKS